MNRKVELWVVGCVAILLMSLMVVFGTVVLDEERGKNSFGPLGNVSVLIAETPMTVGKLLERDRKMEAYNSNRFTGRQGWWFSDGAFSEDLTGYLLISRYDGDLQRHVVDLMSLKDGKLVYTWHPDAAYLLAGLPHNSKIAEYSLWTPKYYRVINPILLENGDLIVKDHKTPLFRIDNCGKKVWSLTSRIFHHSTESDGAGGYWLPSYIEPSKISGVGANLMDESIAHVSADGELLFEKSVAEIFIDNQKISMVFSAGAYLDDPLHINDIQPVLTDGPYWKAGDLFLSLRHKSMILLYRPSSNQIIWYKEGPWLSQHDVDILDDHRISVFNNNAVNKGNGGKVDGHSKVTIYDFRTDAVTNPFDEVMAKEEVSSMYEGRADILPSGHAFVEEENSGRLLLLSPEGEKLMEFVNRASDGNLYRLGWSRYINEELGDAVVQSLSGRPCES